VSKVLKRQEHHHARARGIVISVRTAGMIDGCRGKKIFHHEWKHPSPEAGLTDWLTQARDQKPVVTFLSYHLAVVPIV